MFGYEIIGNRFKAQYIVISKSQEKANELIRKEVKELLSLEHGWMWGDNPQIMPVEIEEFKKIHSINVVWE